MNTNIRNITRKIASEFNLAGCFLLNPKSGDWSGHKPGDTFQTYLTSLFTSKEPSYFNEIRFFKYNESGQEKVARYCALIPMELEGLDFSFIGVIYHSQDQLQDLLKYRIFPMYLVFWVHQFMSESKLKEAGGEGSQLLAALEEKRIYAQQLESRVASLNAEIEAIKNSEMGLDQKVDELSRLLEEQGREYAGLATAYQELFNDIESVRNEYLESAVTFEHKILDLEVDKRRLKNQVRKLERQAEQKEGFSEKDYLALGARLKKAQEQAARYNRLYEGLKAELGGLEAAQVNKLLHSVKALQERVDYYRDKAMKAEEPKIHRGRELMG